MRRSTAFLATTIPALIAGVAIVGWYANVPILTTGVAGGISLRVSAAVCVLTLSVLLGVRIRLRHAEMRRAVSALCVAVVILVSGASIIHAVAGGWNVEHLFFPGAEDGRRPMATLTATCLIALAVSMMAIRNPSRAIATLSRALAGFSTLSSLFVLLGYAYGVSAYYGDRQRLAMSLPAAAAIFLLSIGVAGAKSKTGWYGVLFTETTPAARVARRTILIAAVTLATLGWIRIVGQEAGLFDLQYAVALMITIQVAVTTLLILWGARLLDAEFKRRVVREEELSASNERYLLVTRATEDATYDWDLVAGRYYWNEAAQGKYGFPAFEDAGSGSAWADRLHPEDRDETRASFAAACIGSDTSWTAEYRIASREGQWVDVLERCFIVRDDTGLATRAVGALTDVGRVREAERILRSAHEELERLVEERTNDLSMTNRRLTAEIARRKGIEDVLRQERDFISTVMNSSAALTVVTDIEAKVVRFSRACELLTGWNEREALGRTVSELLVPEDERAGVEETIRALVAGERANQHENDWVTRDGRRRRIAWKNSTIRDEHGFVTFVVATGIDVTEEREARAALVANRDELASTASALRIANEELEAFSYSVSHDLRAPLRAIAGFSQALVEDYTADLNDEAKHYLSRIQNASMRMTELIDGLLTLSRISRADLLFDDVNLSQMVAEAIHRLRETQGERHVEVTVEPDVHVRADPRLMRVVVENLVQNAWKFTGRKAEAMIEFGVSECNGVRRYYIADNGAGFDMQYAAKLFAPFQRLHSATDFAGSGIGLATVKRVIARHGGTVGATSDPGAGTTFHFTLGTDHES